MGHTGTQDYIIENEQKVPAAYSLKQLVLYFLRLGTLGFGGPVALVGYMHSDLVEKRKWISEAGYKEGLDIPTAIIAIAVILLPIYTKKIQEPFIILTAAIIGIILKMLL